MTKQKNNALDKRKLLLEMRKCIRAWENVRRVSQDLYVELEYKGSVDGVAYIRDMVNRGFFDLPPTKRKRK